MANVVTAFVPSFTMPLERMRLCSVVVLSLFHQPLSRASPTFAWHQSTTATMCFSIPGRLPTELVGSSGTVEMDDSPLGSRTLRFLLRMHSWPNPAVGFVHDVTLRFEVQDGGVLRVVGPHTCWTCRIGAFRAV